MNLSIKSKDGLGDDILKIINNFSEPLETKEIESKLPDETRAKILNRLKDLRGEGLIKGKMVGAGQGTWIWWKKCAFSNSNDDVGGDNRR